MRIGLIGSSLLAVSLMLSACNVNPAPNEAEASEADTQPAQWTASAADQLRDAISKRGAHGLDQMQFDVPDGAGDSTALTKAALAYAGALARGATDPTKLFEVYTVARPNPNLQQGLAQALQQGKLGAWLESLAPQDDHYRKLSDAYVALRKQGQGSASPAIPDKGEPIDPGQTDERIPAIAQQLVASDYLDRSEANGNRYTPAMAAAVKQMQTAYGIKPDGVIGSNALGILNLSDADRARAIAVNMERLRWLERTSPGTRIDVNVAAARLSYWRDGKMVDSRKVIVGEPDHETPQLGSPIFRLVANPTWTVPRSIQKNEIAGKGSGYLSRNNMKWENGWIVQQPGPKNSLGLVKFDMQNEHAIYLHDTPAKSLFGEVQRQRSHGCVRVEDALGFAEMLAKDEGVTDEWHKARETGEETFVKLPRQIPVRLLYQTVLFDDAGEPVVRNDPYGWNDRVAEAMGLGASTKYRVKPEGADVGP